MSKKELKVRNRGAYTSPFSGVGMEFYPLGVATDHSGLTLHETGYLPCNDWWVFPHVYSPFWRLYYNFQRGHKVIFPDREVPLEPGHILLIPDHRLFHCHGLTRVSTFWIAFTTALMPDPSQKDPILLKPSHIELGIIREICGLFSRKPSPDTRRRVFNMSLAMLHLTLHREEMKWSEQREPEGLARAVKQIEKDYAAPLRLKSLANSAGITVRGLVKAFRRHRAVTPAKFIARVRVREAAHLLAHTDLTIDEVAERSGFSNRFHFSRVFRSIAGEPPAHFRSVHG